MTLNILHAPSQWGIGGTEKSAELLVRHHSDDFNVFCVGLTAGGKRAESLRDTGYEVVIPAGANELADYLCEREIDIVHTHSGNQELVSTAAARAGTPIVIRTDQFGRYFQPNSGSNVDYFFYPSKTILFRTLLLNHRRLDENWPKELNFLYNPLDINAVRGGGSMREAYDIPESAKVVGKIGRPVPEKWGKLTVEAFNDALKNVPDTHLFLVGVPNKIRNAIASYDLESRVHCADVLPPEDVSNFYATIDVLAHTSAIGESFGYVIAEAMANGIPSVVDSTPLRDNAQIELINNNETGFVANSSYAFGNALTRLLNDDDLREKFGSAARNRVEEFNVHTVVARLERFYHYLAAEQGLIDQPIETPSLDKERRTIHSFEQEYGQRLQQSFGSDDFLHNLEYQTWRLVRSLPVGRSKAYELFRKGFIFGNEYV